MLELSPQTMQFLWVLLAMIPPDHVLYYSKHHAAERWDLEIGSNTTENIFNFFVVFEKNFCCVWKPNSNSHLSAAWCLLLAPRLFCFKARPIWFMENLNKNKINRVRILLAPKVLLDGGRTIWHRKIWHQDNLAPRKTWHPNYSLTI